MLNPKVGGREGPQAATRDQQGLPSPQPGGPDQVSGAPSSLTPRVPHQRFYKAAILKSQNHRSPEPRVSL